MSRVLDAVAALTEMCKLPRTHVQSEVAVTWLPCRPEFSHIVDKLVELLEECTTPSKKNGAKSSKMVRG